jgi:hypothetical protein
LRALRRQAREKPATVARRPRQNSGLTAKGECRRRGGRPIQRGGLEPTARPPLGSCMTSVSDLGGGITYVRGVAQTSHQFGKLSVMNGKQDAKPADIDTFISPNHSDQDSFYSWSKLDEGHRLIRAFSSIRSATVRQAIVRLVTELSPPEDQNQ